MTGGRVFAAVVVSRILGGLGRREAEHVPQHQDRPLLGRQVLQARHERQRDSLPRVIPRLRARCDVIE